MRATAALLCVLSLVTARAGFASATGFVYVLDPAGCTTCAGPQLLVFDGGTTQLVTRIPLEPNTTPAGIALSADGAHLYVSNFRGSVSSISVIDARHHVFLATYPIGSIAGQLAVSGDDSAVFIRVGTMLSRFDTATHTITASATVGNGSGVAFNVSTDTVLVGATGPGGSGVVTAHDPVSLAEIRRASIATGVIALSPSRTGARIHVLRNQAGAGQPTALTRLDASTLAVIDDRLLSNASGLGAPAHAPSRTAIYIGGQSVVEIPEGSGALTTIPLPVTTLATAITIPPGEKFAFITAARGGATGLTAVAAIDLDTRQIVSSFPLDDPPGVDLMTSTPDSAVSCTYRLNSADASFSIRATTAVSILLSTDCAWQASTAATWVHLSATSGIGNATVTITADANGTGQRRQAQANIGGQLVTVTQAGANAQPPFGSFDTPGDGVTVSGAIAVTGWALDDVGVDRVDIYRDPVAGESPVQVFLGRATFVRGTRPDVQAIFPTLPFASRAGWGYQLLTNALPGGDGRRRLFAYATDIDGHVVALGTRTINVANTASSLPFGSIDTPGQGETVSGAIANWGWALTPQPANIPTDGSTIDVVIDGVVVGHPTFGLDRSDIAALFPNYANTHSAVGVFTIDTTTLANGVHTLAWIVRDSLGRAQGIGSRFFTVQNP
jgi:DNA-binding beta-propeller fold protein YncE